MNLRFFAFLRSRSYQYSPSYTDEESKKNVDSETVCLTLLITGLIVPLKTLDTVYSLSLITFVLTSYSPSCRGQETKKGLFGVRVKLPPAHLSTTLGGDFNTVIFNAKRQVGGLWIPIS